jgi:hypothetical protein
MIPSSQPEFDGNNCVVVPMAFFDKLLRCYYGTGPRDGDPVHRLAPESPAVEVIPDITHLKEAYIDTSAPPGYTPRGAALRKSKAKQSGTRHDQAPEEQESPSEDN